MIDGCKNPDPVRGFFNEYLRADQLSGLGFSSTSHNDVVVKVDNKSFKIIF